MASKNHNVCYDAKLLYANEEKMSKPKKVLCYVSPKQLIIKEMILKFIPKRLFTFRLCPSTKVMHLDRSFDSLIVSIFSFTFNQWLRTI